MMYSHALIAALALTLVLLFISDHGAWRWRTRFEQLRDAVMEFPARDIGDLQELADNLTPPEEKIRERVDEWLSIALARLARRLLQ